MNQQSKRRITTMKTDFNNYDLVIADITHKILYVSNATLKRSHDPNTQAARILHTYQALLPTYRMEVNDKFFRKNPAMFKACAKRMTLN